MNMKEILKEIRSNSYRADHHEGDEIVIEYSRVEEIIKENINYFLERLVFGGAG